MATMNVKIREVLGVEKADFQIGQDVTLISGVNGSGKSSLVDALRALLSGEGLCRGIRAKKDAWTLLRLHADGKRAELGVAALKTFDGGEARLSWPDCIYVAKGKVPAVHGIAIGSTPLMAMKEDDRARALIDVMKAEPNFQDLLTHLVQHGLDDKLAKQVWTVITEKHAGEWESACKEIKEGGTRLKGQWEQATGEKKYGEKKAASWEPDGWDLDLAELTQEQVDRDVEEAQSHLEAVLAQAAVDEAEMKRLRTLAGELAQRTEEWAKLNTAVDPLRDEIAAIEKELAALPPRESGGMPCPSCGKKLVMKPLKEGVSQLVLAQDLSERELKEARSAFAKLDGRLSNRRTALTETVRGIGEAERRVGEARKAKADLMAAEDRKGDTKQIPSARLSVETAQKRKLAWLRKKEGDRLHRAILRNGIIADALGPDGVRAQKLRETITIFNTLLVPFWQKAGMKKIELSEQLHLAYGDIGYAQASESERWRVDLVLQLAFAKLTNSEIVVVDRFDVVDPKSRGPIIKMIRNVKVPAVMAMTASAPEKVPNLAKAGIGVTYWMETGVILSHEEEDAGVRRTVSVEGTRSAAQ